MNNFKDDPLRIIEEEPDKLVEVGRVGPKRIELIKKAWVEQRDGYNDGQERIIYIVSNIERIEECNLDYVFTDGHAVMMLTDFFNDKKDLDKIDWEIMNSRYWNDTAEDGDRKRRRQAEFLLHQFLPVTAILGIGVYDIAVKNEVDEELSKSGAQTPVKVFQYWYY